uniref:Large polyvalent protein associated domain-containing protein n=1 Tax=viral metagenome TaxID=1070528 RepID=A0A6M3KDW5_9ZZZZ
MIGLPEDKKITGLSLVTPEQEAGKKEFPLTPVFPGRYPPGIGDFANSNVLLGTFNSDGQVYVLPTMEEGKKLNDPFSTARQHGLEKYPRFGSTEEAEAWIQENHGRVREDGTINAPLRPKTPEKKVRFEQFNPIKGLELILTTPSRLLMKGMDKLATSPFAQRAEEQIPKTLTGIAEAPLTMATGTSAFVAGMAGQAAKTAADVFGESAVGQPERASAILYELWRTGFKDVSGEGSKRGILTRLGENADVFNKVMDIFTHMPKTEAGAHVVRTAASPLELIEKGVDYIGKKHGMSEKERGGMTFFVRVLYPKILGGMKALPTKARAIADVASRNKALKTRFKAMEQEGYSPINVENAIFGEKIWEQAGRQVEAKVKASKGGLRESFVSNVIDISGNARRAISALGERGKRTMMHHDAVKGSTPRGFMLIDEANARLTKGLTKKEIERLNWGVKAARELEIKRYKPKHTHPRGADTQVFIDQLNALPPRVLERVLEYEKVMRENTIDRLLSEKIITKEQHTNLASKGLYSPRQIIDYMNVEDFSTIKPKGKESVAGSGLRELKSGSLLDINPNAIAQLHDTIMATDARIAENRVGKSLYRLASEDPQNGIMSVVHPSRHDSPPPKGQEYVFTMIDGRKHAVSMPAEIAGEFVRADPIFSQQQANALGWVSGSKILKAQATGYNPEFATRNIFRDSALIWLATEEYHAAAPIMAGQLLKDIITVLPDALMRKGRYRDYKMEGGGMDFLTQQGQVAPNLKGAVGAVQTVASYLNNTSEMLTRLALRERAIKNGKSQFEATQIARNYLDFAQGGRAIKALDSVVPYLNASVQGTRSVFRAAKTNPVIFASKIAQLMVLSQGLYYANKFIYGSKYDEISPQDRINNWNIMLPFSYKDESGTDRQHYLKIPKDQSQRAFSALFEGMAAKAIGDEDYDYGLIAEAGKQFLPIVPTEGLPPTIEAALTYGFNMDMWTNEKVWKGTEQADKTQEFTERTPPIFAKGAEAVKDVTGIELSPERLRSALGTIFTRHNPYTDLVGIGLHKLMQEMPEADRHRVSNEIMQRMPVIKQFLGSTNPSHRMLRQVGEVKREENTRKTIQNRAIDDLADKYYGNKELGYSPSVEELERYIKTQPLADAIRITERFMHQGVVRSLPNRSWWLSLSGMPSPEARATAFYKEWKRVGEVEQRGLFETALKMEGIMSSRFLAKFSELGGVSPIKQEKPTSGIKSLEIIW